MLEQSTLELEPVKLEAGDFQPILKNIDKGVPSAHDPEKRYFPRYDGNKWVCDGPSGPCEHFRIYKTPCRHILKERFDNINELYKKISEKIEYNRDIRDLDCEEFEDVITYVSFFKGDEINKIATTILNIAVMRGKVSSDELHVATNEQYADTKIVGITFGSLLRSGFLEVVGMKSTERRIAHGRRILIFKITEKGYELLRESRTEKPLVS